MFLIDFGYSQLEAGYNFRFSNTKADMSFGNDTRNILISVPNFDDINMLFSADPVLYLIKWDKLSEHKLAAQELCTLALFKKKEEERIEVW